MAVVLPLSGQRAVEGNDALRGIQLALQSDRLGGVGASISVQVLDSGDELDLVALGEAVEAWQPGALIVGVTEAEVVVAARNARDVTAVPIVAIAEASVVSNSTALFELTASRRHKAEAAAAFAMREGWSQTVLVTDQSRSAEAYRRRFSIAFKRLGGAILATVTAPEGSIDGSSAVLGGDVLVVAGDLAHGLTAIEEAATAGYSGPVIADEAWPPEDVVAANFANDVYMLKYVCPDDDAFVAFSSSYTAMFGGAPGDDGALAFDAMLVLGIAVERAGRHGALEESLHGHDFSDEPLVTGGFRFDASGKPTDKEFAVLRLRGGATSCAMRVKKPDLSALPR